VKHPRHFCRAALAGSIREGPCRRPLLHTRDSIDTVHGKESSTALDHAARTSGSGHPSMVGGDCAQSPQDPHRVRRRRRIGWQCEQQRDDRREQRPVRQRRWTAADRVDGNVWRATWELQAAFRFSRDRQIGFTLSRLPRRPAVEPSVRTFPGHKRNCFLRGVLATRCCLPAPPVP